jgi:CHAT domain-containing protein
MLAGTGRFDLQAMAHYHLATSLRRTGDLSEAQKQLSAAYALFGQMPEGSSQQFVRASSEVELAEIEIAEGNLASAQTRLQSGARAIEETDNVVVQLAYFNAWADLERHRNRPAEEWKHLEKAFAIARRGFTSLGSMDNRWDWYREVDRSYHRLVELELDVKHDPVQALADWEAYRAAEIAPSNLAPGNSRDRLVSRVKELHSATLISFIVFPERVAIWVADDRGIHTFSVQVDSETLKSEAEGFLRLCSDRNSPLEKVSRTGSRLYQRLFDPIEAALALDRTLAIEADSFLSRIPWPALVAPSGDYLSQKYMTVNTPGLFFAAPDRSRKSSAGPALVAYPGAVEYEGKPYPPLPHAKEEADYVASLFPGSTLLQEEHVTFDELMRLLPHSSAFHFAGHAVSREHGGELLLPGNQAVSSSAIRRLNLSGMELVVLSACSTAEADLDVARSPNGLVQAFLSAGAREVVASRWDTDSKASLSFMKEFYRSLHDTRDAVRAMKISRDHMIQQKTTTHPFYWSAFELFETLNEASH